MAKECRERGKTEDGREKKLFFPFIFNLGAFKVFLVQVNIFFYKWFSLVGRSLVGKMLQLEKRNYSLKMVKKIDIGFKK